jgi:hypothetical protein
MFSDKSRYKNVTQYEVTDQRGRTVKVVAVPPAPQQTIKGYHLLKQGQLTDHLASLYINDAAGFWRIAEANGAMLPEALSEQSEIAIPNKI